jgi:hypothetical protein
MALFVWREVTMAAQIRILGQKARRGERMTKGQGLEVGDGKREKTSFCRYPYSKSSTSGTGGGLIPSTPSTTSHFIITAAGIERTGGPSVFTRDRFEGIKIEATGQNIITLGDGNQVNARFQALGESLAELRNAIKESAQLNETQKMEVRRGNPQSVGDPPCEM